jgi:hypothetical protein
VTGLTGPYHDRVTAHCFWHRPLKMLWVQVATHSLKSNFYTNALCISFDYERLKKSTCCWLPICWPLSISLSTFLVLVCLLVCVMVCLLVCQLSCLFACLRACLSVCMYVSTEYASPFDLSPSKLTRQACLTGVSLIPYYLLKNSFLPVPPT